MVKLEYLKLDSIYTTVLRYTTSKTRALAQNRRVLIQSNDATTRLGAGQDVSHL